MNHRLWFILSVNLPAVCDVVLLPHRARGGWDLILGAMITNEYNQAESGLVSSKHFFIERFMVFLNRKILEKILMFKNSFLS